MNRVPRPARRTPGLRRRSGRGPVAVSVWLRLLKSHGLLLREVRRRVPQGLTLPQFDVLAQLYRRPPGMTPGELTRELLVTGGNVTDVARRLVRLGLVARVAVPEDRRTVRIALTRRGRSVMREAIPRHRRDVERLMAAIARPDLLRLRELLGRMNRALEPEPR